MTKVHSKYKPFNLFSSSLRLPDSNRLHSLPCSVNFTIVSDIMLEPGISYESIGFSQLKCKKNQDNIR